jgi:hypothetical protein
MNPVDIGDRPQAMASLFQRYRIKNLTAKYIPGCASTTAGTLCFGFVDDDNLTTGVLTGDQILNLRKGCETSVHKNRTLRYTPLDRSKWYYTQQNAAGTAPNDRFTVQSSFVFATGIGATPSTVLGDFDLEGDMEFAGATLLAV